MHWSNVLFIQLLHDLQPLKKQMLGGSYRNIEINLLLKKKSNNSTNLKYIFIVSTELFNGSYTTSPYNGLFCQSWLRKNRIFWQIYVFTQATKKYPKDRKPSV